MMESLRLIAVCPDELKTVVAAELEAIGATEVKPGYKAVYFSGSPEVYYKAHLWLRSANRILREIKEFSAAKKEVIYDQTRRIAWDKFFGPEKTFVIETVVADKERSKVSPGDINNKIREGIIQCFTNRIGKAPKASRFEPDITIVAYVNRGRCTLSIDTTGKNLHKRGYREDGHPAPLKENLAAAILRLLNYDGSQCLMAPMCGSGTLAIEAAYIALNKSPQIHRGKDEFGFEKLKDFDRQLWRKLQEEARQKMRSAPEAPIYASDIDRSYIELARKNALNARVEKHIHFSVEAFQRCKPPKQTGILVANLPYGERLNTQKELESLYKEIGDHLKKNFQGWTAGLLIADEAPQSGIGLKPQKKIPLLNGSLPVKLLIFEIYAGTRSGPKDQQS